MYDLGTELNDFIQKIPLESVLMCYGSVKLRPISEINKVPFIYLHDLIIYKLS